MVVVVVVVVGVDVVVEAATPVVVVDAWATVDDVVVVPGAEVEVEVGAVVAGGRLVVVDEGPRLESVVPPLDWLEPTTEASGLPTSNSTAVTVRRANTKTSPTEAARALQLIRHRWPSR